MVLPLGSRQGLRGRREGTTDVGHPKTPPHFGLTRTIVFVPVTLQVRRRSPCAHADRTLVSFGLGWSMASRTTGSGVLREGLLRELHEDLFPSDVTAATAYSVTSKDSAIEIKHELLFGRELPLDG